MKIGFKKMAILLGILPLILVLSSCKNNDSVNKNQETASKEIKMMEINEISSMDSGNALDGGSFIAITQVIEGLYNLDADDNIIPGVATDLPEISKDGLTYTVPLRKDAKWSDGSSVTAKDFVYAWRRVVNPKYGSPSSFLLFDIKNAEEIINGHKKTEELGVQAKDDHTLVVTLEHPVAYFTSVMTFPTLFPINQAYAEKQGKNYGLDSDHLLYNGPYKLKEWKHGNQKWQYKKNDLYWNKKQSNLDVVNIQVVKDTNLAVNLYQNGDLDRAVLSGEFARQYKNDPDYTTQLDSWVHLIEINQKRKDIATIFENKKARQAIAMAIDREHMVNEILNNDSQAIYGVVAAEFIGNPKTGEDFRAESGNLVTFDQEKAKKLWAEVLKETGQTEVHLDLLASDQDENKAITEYLQYAMENTLQGLKINISLLPEKSLMDREENQAFDLLLTRIGPDFQDPMTYLNNYAEESFKNHSSYISKDYNHLLAKAKKLSTDPVKRWQTLIEAEHVLMDEAGVIPVYQSANTALMRQNITGMIHHLFGPPNYYGKIMLK